VCPPLIFFHCILTGEWRKTDSGKIITQSAIRTLVYEIGTNPGGISCARGVFEITGIGSDGCRGQKKKI
jgi:hypothetical protein